MVKGKAWLGMALVAAVGCGRLARTDQPHPASPAPAGSGGSGSTDPGGGGTPVNPSPSPPIGGGPVVGPGAECSLLGTARVTDPPGSASRPAIAWTGTGYLVVWADARSGSTDLYTTTLNVTGGKVTPDTMIAHMVKPLTGPQLARLGDGRFAVVFEICTAPACDGANAVGAVMLGPDGRPAGAPVELSAPLVIQRRPYVTAGFGGAYATFRDVAGAMVVPRVVRLGADGTASPTSATMGGGAEGLYPHLAFGGDRLAMVYRRTGASPEIVLDILDQGLAVQNEVVIRTGNPADATNPVVAWTGQSWSVAWEDLASGEPRIMVSVVAADGSSALTGSIAFGGNGNWPAIVSNGRMGVVAFYGFPAGPQIMLTRVDGAGEPVGGLLQITDEPDHGKYPSLAHDDVDDEIGVVWQDDTAGTIGFAHVKCP